jgi:hypothetical protein
MNLSKGFNPGFNPTKHLAQLIEHRFKQSFLNMPLNFKGIALDKKTCRFHDPKLFRDMV